MVETFPNAPITEALFEIKTKLPSSASLSSLEGLHPQIESDYPTKKPRTTWESTIEFKAEKEPITKNTSRVDGYFFGSTDKKQVVQYRLDGFTFSRLHPYTKWEKVYEEARRLWDIYRMGVKPVHVTQLAVRYINSIEIPSKDFEFEEYFPEPPRVPRGLPQLIDNFFTRLEIPFPEEGARAIVIQTPSPKKSPTTTVILLDIAVFTEVEFSPDVPELWDSFRNLRKIKNNIFFSSLTEKTKELFR